MSKNKKLVISLLVIVVLMAIVPLFMLKNAEFGGSDKSYKLAKLYEIHAGVEGCYYINAGECSKMNEIDYMHLDAESHNNLAKKIADIIKTAGNNQVI